MTLQLITQCCRGWSNFNLQCSTICDNVCWTVLRVYVKLTYICWTINQIYIAIICSQFLIRKDSWVGSTLASLRKPEVPGSNSRHPTWQSFVFLSVYDDILLARDFYISFHSLSLFFFSNWGGLDIYSTFHANFCSFLIFHEFEFTDISTPQQLTATGRHVYSFLSVQLRLNLFVCDRSVSVNVITHTFVGLKCLTESKIQILCYHVSHTRLHTVEMGCQMVQLLSAHIVGPTMCVNLTLAYNRIVQSPHENYFNVCQQHKEKWGLMKTTIDASSGRTMLTYYSSSTIKYKNLIIFLVVGNNKPIAPTPKGL